MTRLYLSLLGPFRATLDGQPVAGFESDKVRALLAYLAVESGRPHHRETLAGLLWPERPESSARRNLCQALYNLRCAICDRDTTPSFLTVTRHTLHFNRASGHRLDTAALTALLDACKEHCHRRLSACEECMERLRQAVVLYRGSFLEGFSLGDSPAFEEWTLLQQERFHRLIMEALGSLTVACEQRGEYEAAIGYIRRGLALDPWREEAYRLLMRLLALSGQRSAALAQYKTCCRILSEELGVEPAEETVALYEHIREGADERTMGSGPPHNLPASLTPFVGREAELAAIEDRLREPGCRLLTLFGPGGVGKTRLALEAARDLREGYPHGVYFVPLVALQSVDAVVPTIGEALDFPFSSTGEPRQQLLDYLRQKQMLLILDSFEHLLACPERGRLSDVEGRGQRDGTEVVIDVLRAAPDVKIVVTSRARLNVKGEHLVVVAGMDVPGIEATSETLRYDAVRLFLDGARRVRPDLKPAEGDVRDVARICRLVQGMPLAILLAAAWIDVLTPAEIANEIGRGIDFLAAEWRDVPQRQRSVRAVFDRSWELIPGRQREVFRGLSVFRGGFCHQAARQVTGASLQDLKALVDRSRLHRTSKGRYEVHELLRQYAAEKLDRSPDGGASVRDRHAAYNAAALERWAADLKTDRQQAALAEMDTEIENARAAWNWAVERGQVARLDEAVEGLCLFYDMRIRHEEGEAVCRLAAEKLRAIKEDAGRRVRARILAWQSRFNRLLGRPEAAGQLVQEGLAQLESLELAGRDTHLDRAFVLLEMGHVAAITDRKKAKRLYEQGLALCRALDDRWWMANVLYALGGIGHSTSAYAEAQRWYKEGLTLYRALGDPRGTADSLVWLGFNHIRQGQIEDGGRLIGEGSAIREAIGDRAGIAFGLFKLGVALLWQGKIAEGHAMLEECVPLYQDLGLRYEVAYATVFLGTAKMFLGQYEEAHVVVQTGLAQFREMGHRREIAYSLWLLGGLALAKEAYAEAGQVLQQSIAIYRELGQREELSWALAFLGYAARGLGQPCQAKRYLCDALQIGSELRALMPFMLALPGLTLLVVDQGQVERAIELYTWILQHYPPVANSRWHEDMVGRHIAAVAASLPSEVVVAAQERGRARGVQTTVAELLAELGGG